jgi:hypothetical protein
MTFVCPPGSGIEQVGVALPPGPAEEPQQSRIDSRIGRRRDCIDCQEAATPLALEHNAERLSLGVRDSIANNLLHAICYD